MCPLGEDLWNPVPTCSSANGSIVMDPFATRLRISSLPIVAIAGLIPRSNYCQENKTLIVSTSLFLGIGILETYALGGTQLVSEQGLHLIRLV